MAKWSDYAGLSPAGCRPCCSGIAPTPPADCVCALSMPVDFGYIPGPYGSYSSAEAAMAYVGDCIVFMFGAGIAPNSLTGVINSATQAVFAGDIDQNGFGLVISITVPAATTLSIPWSGAMTTSPSGEQSNLYVCSCSTGEFVDDDNNMGTSGTLTAGPLAAGTYYLFMIFSGTAEPPFNTTATYTVNVNTSMVVNPVIARWDDSGTTRILEACPRLYLPPFTESSGNWYADETAAQAAIDDQSFDCLVFTDIAPADYLTFSCTATGGSSLVVSASATEADPGPGALAVLGSINAEDGETLGVAWSMTASGDAGDATTGSMTLTIWDDTGAFIETISDPIASGATSDSGTLTSSALPYTGRYIISLALGPTYLAGNDDAAYAFDATLTSSGTLSTNTVQALYATDPLLDCPARLNC